MSVLAGRLSGDRIEHMPTCAVATFAWDTDDWDVVDSIEPDGLDVRHAPLTGAAGQPGGGLPSISPVVTQPERAPTPGLAGPARQPG